MDPRLREDEDQKHFLPITTITSRGDESNRPDNPYDQRLVRLSIGLEDPLDLIVDLDQALA